MRSILELITSPLKLVWTETKEVGFGVAHDPEVGVVVVAKYSPHGNSTDQYDLKVMHPERPWKEVKEEERKMVEERTARRRARAKEVAKDGACSLWCGI